MLGRPLISQEEAELYARDWSLQEEKGKCAFPVEEIRLMCFSSSISLSRMSK